MAVDAMVAIAPILSGMLLALDRAWIPGAVISPAAAGLGLPIARAVAEAQGGSLTVAHRAGAGSVFSLTVPVCRQPEVVS